MTVASRWSAPDELQNLCEKGIARRAPRDEVKDPAILVRIEDEDGPVIWIPEDQRGIWPDVLVGGQELSVLLGDPLQVGCDRFIAGRLKV